jgi:hypothetical protein
MASFNCRTLRLAARYADLKDILIGSNQWHSLLMGEASLQVAKRPHVFGISPQDARNAGSKGFRWLQIQRNFPPIAAQFSLPVPRIAHNSGMWHQDAKCGASKDI